MRQLGSSGSSSFVPAGVWCDSKKGKTDGSSEQTGLFLTTMAGLKMHTHSLDNLSFVMAFFEGFLSFKNVLSGSYPA